MLGLVSRGAAFDEGHLLAVVGFDVGGGDVGARTEEAGGEGMRRERLVIL